MNKEELLVSLCQEAIRIPSMSGHEKEVAGLLKKTMIDYGFDEVNIDKYGSVLGIIHGSRPGKTVLMDGHIDTVDVIDRDQWSHDPFAAEIDDGSIYCRGTSDMKGLSLIHISTTFCWLPPERLPAFTSTLVVLTFKSATTLLHISSSFVLLTTPDVYKRQM